jgi:hypothetical protein
VIEREALAGAELSALLLPASLEVIGEAAFAGCCALADVRFAPPSALREIGARAFAESGIQAIDVPGPLRALGNSAFSGCRSLRLVAFAGNAVLQTVGEYAFFDSLEAIRFPASACDIDALALATVKTVSIEVGNTHYAAEGQFLFDFARTTLVRSFATDATVVVPASVTRLGPGCFAHCGTVRTVRFDGAVEAIGERAFAESALAEIALPATIVFVGARAFPTRCRVLLPDACPRSMLIWRTALVTDPFRVLDRLKRIEPAPPPTGGQSLKVVLDTLPIWWTPTARAITAAGLAIALGTGTGGERPLVVVSDAVWIDERMGITLRAVANIDRRDRLIYAAPELDAVPRASEKADVYAYGAMLYEILMSTRMLSQKLRKRAAALIVEGKKPPVPSDIPQFARALVARCWDDDPAVRSSFRQILVELASHNYEILYGVDPAEVRHLRSRRSNSLARTDVSSEFKRQKG